MAIIIKKNGQLAAHVNGQQATRRQAQAAKRLGVGFDDLLVITDEDVEAAKDTAKNQTTKMHPFLVNYKSRTNDRGWFDREGGQVWCEVSFTEEDDRCYNLHLFNEDASSECNGDPRRARSWYTCFEYTFSSEEAEQAVETYPAAAILAIRKGLSLGRPETLESFAKVVGLA